jgi:hypothetical protein
MDILKLNRFFYNLFVNRQLLVYENEKTLFWMLFNNFCRRLIFLTQCEPSFLKLIKIMFRSFQTV